MPSVEDPPAKDAGPHTLLAFLQSQPKKALSRLYQRPSSCLCIFRFLLCSRLVEVGLTDTRGDYRLYPKVAWAARKADCYERSLAGCFDTCFYHVFLGRARGEKVSLLYHPLRQSPLLHPQVLTSEQKRPRQYDQALIELSRIDVLVNSATELTLSATFKTSLRQAITGGCVGAGFSLNSPNNPWFRGSTGSFGVPLSGHSEHPTPSIATLDTYALEKWEVPVQKYEFEYVLKAFSSRFSITWSHPGPVYHQRNRLLV